MKINYFFPVLIILLAACSKDDNNGQLDASRASDEISVVASDMSGDVVTLIQSEGVKGAVALVDLLNVSTGLGRTSSFENDTDRALAARQAVKIGNFFSAKVVNLVETDPASIATVTGVYEWNSDTQDFDLIEESDILIIHFPVEDSPTNNGEFKLLAYESIDSEGEELPTTIQAELFVDEVKYIDLDFSANYSVDGAPEMADISLDVLPFSVEFSFNDTEAVSSSVSTAILLEGDHLVGVDVEVGFETEQKLTPTIMEGFVQYRGLKIAGSVDLTYTGEGDPNQFFNLDLLINEEKAGDIVFVEDIAYVVYEDGSKEMVEEILATVIAEIETLLENLTA